MGCYPSLWILCLCVFFLIFHSRQCLGCMEEERVALLDLKASSGGWFPSWTGNKTSNCCAWIGVACDPISGRVYGLDFDGVDAYFNASMFLPFKDMEYLEMHRINGIDHQGFEKLSKLKNLNSLWLEACSLNSNILASLSELTSLEMLNLDGNHIGEGSSAEISQGFENLSKLNKLEQLSLEDNALNGDILAYLGEFSSLKRVSLGANLIGEGSLSAIWQGTVKTIDFKSLEYLNLRSNYLKTDVLDLLSELTSLTDLDLGSNFLGYGSSAEIYQGFQKLSKLQKLENLNLSDNGLKSNVLSCLSELKSLKKLDLDYNFMGKAEFSDGLSQGN